GRSPLRGQDRCPRPQDADAVARRQPARTLLDTEWRFASGAIAHAERTAGGRGRLYPRLPDGQEVHGYAVWPRPQYLSQLSGDGRSGGPGAAEYVAATAYRSPHQYWWLRVLRLHDIGWRHSGWRRLCRDGAGTATQRPTRMGS